MEEETVTITKTCFDKLVKDAELLECLIAAGVDNWDGWDLAIEMFKDE